MDSVMDISVFEVSITLFKRLYVSILRGLEIQIVIDDYIKLIHEYGCIGLQIWLRRVTNMTA